MYTKENITLEKDKMDKGKIMNKHTCIVEDGRDTS